MWSSLQTEGIPPQPRDSHVAVIHGSSMFVFGGSTGSAKDDFYELDIRRSTWSPVRQPKLPNSSSMKALSNSSSDNRISKGGGGNDLFDQSDSFRGGDVELNGDEEGYGEDMFAEGAEQLQPGSRFCHVACVYDHAMYVFGGRMMFCRIWDSCTFPLMLYYRILKATRASYNDDLQQF